MDDGGRKSESAAWDRSPYEGPGGRTRRSSRSRGYPGPVLASTRSPAHHVYYTPPVDPLSSEPGTEASRVASSHPPDTAHNPRQRASGDPLDAGSVENHPGGRLLLARVRPSVAIGVPKRLRDDRDARILRSTRGAGASWVALRRSFAGRLRGDQEAGAAIGDCVSWTGGCCRPCVSADGIADPAALAVGSDRWASSTNAEAVQSPTGRVRKWA